MKVTPHIDIAEMVSMLQMILEEKCGCELEGIVITSYDKPKIVIEAGKGAGVLVTCEAFNHRTRE